MDIQPQENDRVTRLLEYLKEVQYTYERKLGRRNNSDSNSDSDIKPITTRFDLQQLHIPKGTLISKTSGTSGVPVVVPKTLEDRIWHRATNLLELYWRKWDISLLKVSITPSFKEDRFDSITNTYQKTLDSIVNIQKFLEEVQPHYIFTFPSIVEQLDLSKLTRLIDIRTYGEVGASSYSAEEVGTIALKCPDNPNVYHIMPNIIVESHPEHGALITNLNNRYITRYAIGDIVELGDKDELCGCGRTLPIIKKILGRKRDMLVLPDGQRRWATVGEKNFLAVTNYKIMRHQVIQKELYKFEIRIQARDILTPNEHRDLCNVLKETIGYPIECYVTYLEQFPLTKFESFISEIK